MRWGWVSRSILRRARRADRASGCHTIVKLSWSDVPPEGCTRFGNDIEMNQRFLIWGVAGGIFAIALAISSWSSGLLQSDPVERTNKTPSAPIILAKQNQAPLRPFAPATTSSTTTAPAPATASPGLAAAPPPSPPPPPALPPPPEYPPDGTPAPPPEMTESLLESGPGVDNEEVLARRERARAERRNAESH